MRVGRAGLDQVDRDLNVTAYGVRITAQLVGRVDQVLSNLAVEALTAMKLRLWNSLEMPYKPEIKKNFMKAWHFLQVSSEIIAKHRHRSDVTGMTISTPRRYLDWRSTQTVLEQRPRQSGSADPSRVYG